MRMGADHVPDLVPEPSPPARPARVRRSGPVNMPVPAGMTGLANVAGAAQDRLGISHGTQDARNLRLQHLHNSHPGATAKDPQSRQPVTSSSLSSWRTRCRMSSRMGRTASTPRPAGSGRSQSR